MIIYVCILLKFELVWIFFFEQTKMDYITESLEILAQGVRKPQLKESDTRMPKRPKQDQKIKLPYYINISKQGKGFNHHEW